MNAVKPPVEGKVWAGTVGGGTGATLSTFALWVLGVTVWHAPTSAEEAQAAIGAVPFPVVGIVFLVLSVGGYFLGGYLAKHTPRPEVTEGLARVEEAEGVVDDDTSDLELADNQDPDEDLGDDFYTVRDGESQEEYEARVQSAGEGHYPVSEYPNPRDIEGDSDRPVTGP